MDKTTTTMARTAVPQKNWILIQFSQFPIWKLTVWFLRSH